MRGVDQGLAQIIQSWQQWELRTVIRGDSLEDVVPVPEFRTIIDAGRPIFDASAKDPFVLTDTCRFGRALRLFRKIDVLDTQES